MMKLDKKGFTEAQVKAAFADAEGKGLFETAVREYAHNNPAKGVWATVQAGYDLAAQYYSSHGGKMPVGVLDTKAFGALADKLAE